MRRFLIGFFALTLAVAFAVPAQASALNLLTLDGEVDLLEDDDWEVFVDSDGELTFGASGDGTIDIGDYVLGMIEISAVNGTGIGDGNPTFTAVLAAEVVDVDAFASAFVGGTTLTFGAISAVDYAALQAGNWSNLPGRNSADTAVIVYDGTRGDLDQGDGTGDPNDGLATAQQGPLLFEFGFTTDLGDAAAFSEADLRVDANGFADFNFEGGLNLTFNNTGLVLLKHAHLSDGPPAPQYRFSDNRNTGDTHHLQFIGQLGGESQGDFDVNTDTDIFINAVPEPTSLALFALGGLGMLRAGYRRRRGAAKQAAV